MNVSTFLSGGGEMGALTRSYDWANSPLGHPNQWPQSLLTTVSLLLNSKFPMFLWWGEDHIQFYNDAYRPSLGVTGKHPKALGQKGKECWPEAWPTIYPLIQQVFSGGESTWQEDAYIPIERNGKLEDVYWTFSYSPVKGEAGKVEGVLVVCTETTRNVQTLQKIREAEAEAKNNAERLELALAAAALGSFEFFFNTGEVICNELCRTQLGLPLTGPVHYDQILSIILEEDKQGKVQALNEAVANHHSYNAEYRVKLSDGQTRWIRAAGNPMYDNSGQPVKMVGITIDITKQKKFTEELGRQVLERTNELQRSNEDLLQFAHVISHDLKEPVRKIMIWSGRLQADTNSHLSDTGGFYLERLQHATNRIKLMIDSILNFSTATSSNQVIEKVDLNEILDQVQSDLEMLIQDKGAVINKEPLPTIEGANILLYQLFYNLLNNSLKFTREGVQPMIVIKAAISMQDNGKFVRIDICDNGIGFDKQYSQKIFSAFTRLNSKDTYEGTGLGLALCQRIVERHGGSISSTAMEGEGATFTIMLPLHQSQNSNRNLLSGVQTT